MNLKIRNEITIIILLIAFAGYAQTVDPPYQVGTWQGFRTVALSFTFDDGSPNQFTKVIPMFNEFNFKLTLFTITSPSWSWPANWTTLQNVANQGHEIASHTISHPYLNQIDSSQQRTEFKDSHDYINSHISGQRCVTIAYPYCINGTNTICDDYYIAARTCSGAIEPSTPGDFMSISSIICGTEGPMKTKKNFVDNFNTAVNSKGWCVYLLHGIDGDGGWSSLPSDTLRATLVYLNANQDKFWVSSFSNVARYIRERNAVSVTELSNQDSSITLQVTDTLIDSVFNYPISLRRPLPEGWPSAEVTQNGHSRYTRIVEVNSIQYIQFDVVPDNGTVLITRSNLSGMQNHSGLMVPEPTLSQNYPNPFNPTTTIKFKIPGATFTTLSMYDVLGKEVAVLLEENLAAGEHTVQLNAANMASGIYFYRLRGEEFLLQRKMLLLR
jgi:peptidoglycan/xylan/chitin deacetylase (PgdA/CDA1 family)